MRHYEKPIYDKKVEKILELLKFMTRDEAAEELGYKNYRGMDQYMRRKNFVFDQKQMQYIPAINRVSELDRDPKSYAPTKVVRIIFLFPSFIYSP
jgi:predicted Zn-dependent protease